MFYVFPSFPSIAALSAVTGHVTVEDLTCPVTVGEPDWSCDREGDLTGHVTVGVLPHSSPIENSLKLQCRVQMILSYLNETKQTIKTI